MVAIFNSLKNQFLLCFDTLVSSSGSCIFLTYFKLLEKTFISYKTNEFLLLLIQIVCLYNLFVNLREPFHKEKTQQAKHQHLCHLLKI